MKKFLVYLFGAILTFCLVICVGTYGFKCYYEAHRVFATSNEIDYSIGNLDHDINVGAVSQICDVVKTGFDVEVGPTGWPVGVEQKWEVALFEDDDFYYGRMIYHEYMLWWSWDDPYIVCKIPKANVDGNLRTNEKLRWQVLWDITYATERTYNYTPYMQNSVVEKINGHYVSFGSYKCAYEKYLVICDGNYRW